MWRNVLLSLCVAVFFLSCDEDDPKVPDPTPTIEAVSAPSFLLCDAESLYTFSVRVENFDPDSVICLVSRPDGSTELPFRLYDDAGSLTLNSPAYAWEHSGDVVANNGTYTRKIWGNFLCDGEQGEYTFQFEATKGAFHFVADSFVVEVRAPVECYIEDQGFPNQFVACFEPVLFDVLITEDPMIPIDSVSVIFHVGGTVAWQHSLARATNSSHWLMNMSPALFGCTPSGLSYEFFVKAYNRFGLSCQERFGNVLFENDMPDVYNSVMPDTIYRPASAGDSDTLEISIQFSDCNLYGWTVTEAVEFEAHRDDLPWSRAADFFLRNDGVPPDNAAGDLTAASYLVFFNNPDLPNNIYYFRFYSIDCASGDTSTYWLDSTRVIQAGASANGSNANTLDLGLSFFK